MGNSFTQFYSPPTPPTPLSREKYFWLKSPTAINASDAATSGESERNETVVTRDIPVVYITNQSSNNTSKNDDSETNNNDNKVSGTTSSSSQEDSSPRYTVLYCHGHDADLGSTYDFLVHLSKIMGVDVMSFDYAGYGMSNIGTGATADMEEAYSEKPLENVDASAEKDAEKDESGNSEDQGCQSSACGDDMASSGSSHEYVTNNNVAPSEEQCYADILTCYNYLINEKKVPPKSIILYGKSLGSGPVCWLAQKLCTEEMMNRRCEVVDALKAATLDPPAAPNGTTDDVNDKSVSKEGATTLKRSSTPVSLTKAKKNPIKKTAASPLLGGIILHSAFLSILRLKIHVGFPLSSGDAFCNLERLHEMHTSPRNPGWNIPMYLIHGTEDDVVPIIHSKVLYGMIMTRRTKGFPAFWAHGGTHDNIENKFATAYIKRMQQFLKYCDKVNNYKGVKKSRNGNKERSVASHKSEITSSPGIGGVGVVSGHSIDGIFTAQNDEHQQQASNGCVLGYQRSGSSSNSKARQRKKKGTLVMRGCHKGESDAFVPRSSMLSKWASPREDRFESSEAVAPRVVRESREPHNSV